MELIHPIYLDVPMLVSFAAAIEGGLSLEADVTSGTETSKSGSGKAGGKFGLSSLFSKIVDFSVETELSASMSDKDQETRHETKSHTEASVAILLYDKLNRGKGIKHLKSVDDLSAIKPGALVEVAGTIQRNAMDEMVEVLAAIDILLSFSGAATNVKQGANQGKVQQGQRAYSHTTKTQSGQFEGIRSILDVDRKRTPISNALLRCAEPSGVKAVVTLRTANLRDLTLSELNRNSVRVVGKITRIIPKEQSMGVFENLSMGLINAKYLEDLFAQSFIAYENLQIDFSAIRVEGPTFQILPLMIFV